MTEPQRLRGGDATNIERLLLDSAADDAPPPHARARTMSALGFPSAPASVHPVIPPPATTWSLAKWLLFGAGLTLLALPVLLLRRSAPVAPTLPAAVVSTAPLGSASEPLEIEARVAPSTEVPTLAVNASAAPPTTLPPVAAARPTPTASNAIASPSGSAMPDASSLRAETVMLEKARRTLAADHNAEAKETLDLYDRSFPRGVLRPEAVVLRIQTLLAAGDRASAERVANDFVRTDPSGPYARRVRALLSP